MWCMMEWCELGRDIYDRWCGMEWCEIARDIYMICGVGWSGVS